MSLSGEAQGPLVSSSADKRKIGRRKFLSGAAMTGAIATFGGFTPLLNAQPAPFSQDGREGHGASRDATLGPLNPSQRAEAAFKIKKANAEFQRQKPIPLHANNGDESELPGFVGNFHKGLPTVNHFGEVDPDAYRKLLHALNTGKFADYEQIPLGGTLKLVNPQSALAFDTQGIDDQQLLEIPSPATGSAERAAEAVENYWMALSRDVPFNAYGNEPVTQAALAELNHLADYRAPKPVTGKNLFRLGLGDPDLQGTGQFSDTIGPFISQFMVVPRRIGAHQLSGLMQTYRTQADGGVDYLADTASWLAVQQGQSNGNDSANMDPTPRFVRSGRDMSQWVHIDLLYQGYLEAALVLDNHGAPLSPSNPYTQSRTQIGFGTFGGPFIQSLMAECGRRALQAQWFQKWQVHRVLRPEAFGGLVHYQLASGRYPFLHPQVLNSSAVQQVFSKHGTFLLPMAFPEGSPAHPSYASGHATVAGACVTILKAVYDETIPISNLFQPLTASDDGLSLVPYNQSDAGQMTVGGELNKVGMNVAIGRNIAGVHWHSDAAQALLLGEQMAIALLQDLTNTLNEFRTTTGDAFTFHDFRGNFVRI